MVQPIQYLQDAPDPGLSLLRGLQSGQIIRNISQQSQQQEDEQRMQQQYSTDVQQAFDQGTPKAFAELSVKYPQQGKGLQDAYNLLNSDQRNAEFTSGMQLYSALRTGDPKTAENLIQQRITAAKNSGKDTADLENINSLIQKDPKQAAGFLGLTLSSTDPDRFKRLSNQLDTDVERPLNLRKLEAEVVKAEREAGGAEGLGQEKIVGIAKDLRKEYSDQTKTFKELAGSYNNIKAAQDTAAGDISLIFSYMKMLDPGSVVREGEFATAQNAAGVPDRIVNLYNNLRSGERLNPSQRKAFTAQAKAIFEPAEKTEKTVRAGIKRIGNKLGIPDEDLFFDPTQSTQATQATPNQPSYMRFAK